MDWICMHTQGEVRPLGGTPECHFHAVRGDCRWSLDEWFERNGTCSFVLHQLETLNMPHALPIEAAVKSLQGQTDGGSMRWRTFAQTRPSMTAFRFVHAGSSKREALENSAEMKLNVGKPFSELLRGAMPLWASWNRRPFQPYPGQCATYRFTLHNAPTGARRQHIDRLRDGHHVQQLLRAGCHNCRHRAMRRMAREWRCGRVDIDPSRFTAQAALQILQQRQLSERQTLTALRR